MQTQVLVFFKEMSHIRRTNFNQRKREPFSTKAAFAGQAGAMVDIDAACIRVAYKADTLPTAPDLLSDTVAVWGVHMYRGIRNMFTLKHRLLLLLC